VIGDWVIGWVIGDWAIGLSDWPIAQSANDHAITNRKISNQSKYRQSLNSPMRIQHWAM
jgi:hypothetical protein